MRLINHRRFWVDIPNIAWSLLFRKDWYRELFGFSAGHGGDEYGNCSVYVSCALFSVVIFPGLCFQRKVEVPNPGEHPFTDAMYYPDEDPAEWQTPEQQAERLEFWRKYRNEHYGEMPK